jgi:hypothetical protein
MTAALVAHVERSSSASARPPKSEVASALAGHRPATPERENPPFPAGLEERMMGLEPTTFCMASRRSSQLSYIREMTIIAAPPPDPVSR